jgi:hypothetical protein
MGEQRVFITANPAARAVSPSDKDLEDDDPYSLTGVRYPIANGVDADREVALALVEEFALSGWTAKRIRQLFFAPQSGALHEIYLRRGGGFVEQQLGEVFGSGQRDKETSRG